MNTVLQLTTEQVVYIQTALENNPGLAPKIEAMLNDPDQRRALTLIINNADHLDELPDMIEEVRQLTDGLILARETVHRDTNAISDLLKELSNLKTAAA